MLNDITHMLKPAPLIAFDTGVIYQEENISLLGDAIVMCQESNIFYRKMRYNTFNESSVVHEIFDNNSVIAIIKAIIDVFIQNIKELVERFCHVVGSFVNREHHIEKYASQILKFDKVLTIEDFRHYKYTNLEADIPPMAINTQILEDYDKLLEKLTRIGREKYRNELIKKLSKFSVEAKDDFRDKEIFELRGKIVGKKAGVSRELYSEELHKVFRNGQTTPSLGNLYQDDIHDAYRRWKNEAIYTKEIKRQRKVLETNAEEVKKKIRTITLSEITSGNFTVDYDLENILNNILRSECDKIQEICNTTVLAFSAKLEALKEAIIQDKKVLYYCISEIIGS